MSDRLVRTIVRRFANTGIAEDDLFQEGMLALLKAERTFNQSLGVKFETFASLVIRNRLIDVIRSRKAHPEDDFEDLSHIVGKTLEDEVDLSEKRQILEAVLATCNATERAIFNAYFQGFSYEEICGIFAVKPKKIDNTIQKIKKLIKLKDGN